jgi:hypothetical protein
LSVSIFGSTGFHICFSCFFTLSPSIQTFTALVFNALVGVLK